LKKAGASARLCVPLDCPIALSSDVRLTEGEYRISADDRAALRKWSWLLLIGSAIVALIMAARLHLAVDPLAQDSWYPMSKALDFIYRTSGKLVYQTLFFTQHIKFQYPPSGLLLFDAMRHVGIDELWEYNATNVVAMWVCGVVFAVISVGLLGPLRWRGVRLPIGPVAFMMWIKFFPDHLALRLGQIQVLLGLLFLLACWSLLYDRRALAGMLVAAAATMKPQFLLFGVWALWQRDWRFVAAFAAVTGASLVVAIGLYGWDAQVAYLNVLSYLSRHGECFHLNQSVNGVLNRYLAGPCIDFDQRVDPATPIRNSWFPPYNATVYVATLVSSLLLVAAAFVRTKAPDRHATLLAFCTAGLLFTMASPIAWVHHYNILLPGYLIGLKVMIDRHDNNPAWKSLLFLAVSFALTGLGFRPIFGPTDQSSNLVQSHVFFGAVILAVVLLLELHRYRVPQRRLNRKSADAAALVENPAGKLT
jgi:alpha-1,2-mannosyltransferase